MVGQEGSGRHETEAITDLTKFSFLACTNGKNIFTFHLYLYKNREQNWVHNNAKNPSVVIIAIFVMVNVTL